jgi:hypothetical protein
MTRALKAAIPKIAIATTKGIFLIQYFFIRIIFLQSYDGINAKRKCYSVTGGKQEVNAGGVTAVMNCVILTFETKI